MTVIYNIRHRILSNVVPRTEAAGVADTMIEGPKGTTRLLNLHSNILRSRMKKLGIKRSDHEIS